MAGSKQSNQARRSRCRFFVTMFQTALQFVDPAGPADELSHVFRGQTARQPGGFEGFAPLSGGLGPVVFGHVDPAGGSHGFLAGRPLPSIQRREFFQGGQLHFGCL